MYELRASHDFGRLAERWAGSMAQWDEIQRNFDLRLVTDPYWGFLIPGTSLYALPLNTSPFLTVYYSIDDVSGTITLESLAEA